MELLFKVIGYASVLVIAASFFFMALHLRRNTRLRPAGLIVPALMSLLILAVYVLLTGAQGFSPVSALLAALGLGTGVIWSRTTRLSFRGGAVYARRSVWYLAVWALSIIIMQLMAVTSEAELLPYGISAVYFSTGLAVGMNTSLLLRGLNGKTSNGRAAVCARCGAANAAGVAYCAGCGSPLGGVSRQAERCRTCGQANGPASAFCAACGRPLRGR
jgi:hypothetical protein